MILNVLLARRIIKKLIDFYLIRLFLLVLIRVTCESFKIPKKEDLNIIIPNPLFLNFTDNEQQKLFNSYIIPKDSASTLSNTDTI